MSPPNLRIRRATMDDLAALKSLWETMRFSADGLEKRLTEFQLVESAQGEMLGAIALQIAGPNALLHSEGYTDFSVADAARQLFWDRIQTIAANHGVFRVWTQEDSPFWVRWGFQPPADEVLARLPDAWKASGGKWLTIQLKNEEAMGVLEKELAAFRKSEKEHAEQVLGRARTLSTVITVAGFGVGILSLAIAIYLIVHHRFVPPLH
jgi:N-acetylglutamate synthase-like GNAT family acetyltransferase